MISDQSLDELHAFARILGIPERGFDLDHYDLPEQLQQRAIEEGALLVSSRELMERLIAAGLRRRKGRHQDSLNSTTAGPDESVTD